MLQRNYLEIYNPCKRDIKDQRKKVSFAVFSYIDRDTKYEYRKSFTAPPNTPEADFWAIAPRIIINL